MADISAVFISIELYSSTLDKLIKKTDQAVNKLLQVTGSTKKAVDNMKAASLMADKAAAKMQKSTSALNNMVNKMDKAGTSTLKITSKLKAAGTSTGKIVNKLEAAGNSTGKTVTKMLKAGTTVDKMLNKLHKSEGSVEKIIGKMQKAGSSTEKIVKGMQKAAELTSKTADKLEIASDNTKEATENFTKASEAVDKLNGKVDKAEGGSELKDLFGSVFNLDNMKKGMKLVDDMARTDTKLNSITNEKQEKAELKNKLFAVAGDSRGTYSDTADTVVKLRSTTGDAFKNNDEALAFTLMAQKSLVATGGSPEERSSVMEQLTNSMAAGGLKGDDISSLTKTAPMIVAALSNYTGASGKDLKTLADQGKITAKDIKNAMFAARVEIDKSFAATPMTFADIWNQIKEGGFEAFSGISDKVTSFISSDDFSGFIDTLTIGMSEIGNAAEEVLNIITSIATFFSDNWSWISPIVWGIVAAFVAYNAVALITNGILMLQAVIQGIKTMATAAEASSTFLATAAQNGLNAALFACPLTWIILAIVLLIAIIYAVVGAINKFAGTSLSATGIIFGAFTTIGAFIGNILIGVLESLFGFINSLFNPFINIANFIGNVFTNPVSSIIYLFQGMADGILASIEKVASSIDLIAGTNLADTVAGWRADIKAFADKTVAKYAPDENYKTLINSLDLSVEDLGISRFSYKEAWDFGYKGGQSLDEKVKGMTNIFSLDGEKNTFDPSKYTDNYDLYNPQNGGDPAPPLPNTAPDGTFNLNNPLPIEGTGPNNSVNVEMPDDDLDYLRDIAERHYIANVATNSLAPNISIQFGDVHENADANKVAGRIREILQNEIAVASEGGY